MSSIAARALIRDDTPRRPSSPLERGQRSLLIAVSVLTVAAWLLTLTHAHALTVLSGGALVGAPHHLAHPGLEDAAQLAGSGMGGAGWSVAGVVVFVVAWAVMMAAMMFPGLAPMLLTVHAIAVRRRGPQGTILPTAVFVAGYLLVWTAVGALTWVMVHVLGLVASRFDLATRANWAPLVLGGTMIVAGLYQFTAVKQVCLDHCRSPFIVVMQRWREGHAGALRMGFGHGLYCLGCCWALFTVLVAAGIMSLAWMLALTAIDVAEKTVPSAWRAPRLVGTVFVLLGIAVVTGIIRPPGGA
jgi:predicted metal-binding membrane protein